MRSDTHVSKNFKLGMIRAHTFNGLYTVVDITINPPPPQLSGLYCLQVSDPPAVLRYRDGSVTISALSRGYSITDVRLACLAPLRIRQLVCQADLEESQGVKNLTADPIEPRSHLMNLV